MVSSLFGTLPRIIATGIPSIRTLTRIMSTLVQVWTWGKCDHGELGHGAEVQVPRRVCLPRFHCGARASTRCHGSLCVGGRRFSQRQAFVMIWPTPGSCYDVANAGLLL